MKQNKNIFIQTIGCQMNVYDSELMYKLLYPLNFREVIEMKSADLIIINTCSIRERAAEKTFSFLGRMTQLKKNNPGLIVCVTGCVAQNEGDEIFKRSKNVDIVLGTRSIGRLPDIVKKVLKTGKRVIDIEMSEDFDEISYDKTLSIKGNISKFVTIMRGCDNYCTYCVVPYVRGREVSRHPDAIISEITSLVNAGTKEITLLGQNVNSYGIKEKLVSFPELLHKISRVDNLTRIRFATSHPKDLSDELIQAFSDIDKLCNHFHLPIQSGSNKILKRMNRKYTREKYIERVEKLRSVRPNISITSDIIVGFPGETEEDFQETLELIKEVEFDNLYSFKYSDRSVAPASKYDDKIEEEVKSDRLKRLSDCQQIYSIKKSDSFVGKTESVLVEGLSKKHGNQIMEAPEEKQFSGRTSNNKIVNFNWNSSFGSSEELLGKIVSVEIEKARSNSLWGILKNI